ncbi:hypothetical protein D6D21_08051 [Aureobasidium pullulans]|uniref:Uncharacterized protein n=1 Tax=Aureobasidium pullulans TaxID=5580 RepID=A0AB74IQ32_AURPU|nr:hypothetical protein D6D21_08051 [Aureobasidium pullulans]
MATNTNLVAPFNPPPPSLGFRCRICLHNRVVLDRKTLAQMKSHLGCFHHLGPWYCSICGHTDGRADHVAKHITTARSTGHAINHTAAVPVRDQNMQDMIIAEARRCQCPHATANIFPLPTAIVPNVPVPATTTTTFTLPEYIDTVMLFIEPWFRRVMQDPNPATYDYRLRMEDALRSNTAQIEYAQRFSEAREALVEITTIVEYYREIMEEEGDEGEIAAIDEEINNPATLEDCMIMEDELQGEMARVEYAQNATEVCSAVSNALVILRYYRELMQEEGDKDEITNIDEDVMNLRRVKRSAARLVEQGL